VDDPTRALFIFFAVPFSNDSPQENLNTQFLYQLPQNYRSAGSIAVNDKYNIYEIKHLPFARLAGHLARKLFIQMRAGDTARVFEASFLRQPWRRGLLSKFEARFFEPTQSKSRRKAPGVDLPLPHLEES